MANKSQEAFATELKPDTLMVASLWKPDGTRASSIMIEKEVHWSAEKGRHPVFHLYNHADYSKTIPDCGCRVNPRDKPFLSLDEAMELGKKHAEEALASGEWVTVDQVSQRNRRT